MSLTGVTCTGTGSRYQPLSTHWCNIRQTFDIRMLHRVVTGMASCTLGYGIIYFIVSGHVFQGMVSCISGCCTVYFRVLYRVFQGVVPCISGCCTVYFRLWYCIFKDIASCISGYRVHGVAGGALPVLGRGGSRRRTGRIQGPALSEGRSHDPHKQLLCRSVKKPTLYIYCSSGSLNVFDTTIFDYDRACLE